MSEEQKAPVTEEQEKEVEGQNQEQEAASPNQEGESPEQEGEGSTEEGEGSTEEGEGSTEEGEGSTEEDEEDEKPQKKRRYRVRVTGVFHMHPYFWGSLKAVANISIPGFSIRGIRIVQEKDEEEFRVYPPQGWVGRKQRSIIKVHNKEFWAAICEEVSKAYVVSREKWENRKKKGKKEEEGEASEAEASQAETSQAEETQAEAAESKQ